MYIVIIAGGMGERFWPKSVSRKPKQFQKIVSKRSMIQETFRRIYPDVSARNIFVVASEVFSPLILEQLPELSEKNLIIEPARKNTAPAIGLAATYLLKKDPEATMIVLTADHVIGPRSEFMKTLQVAARVADKGFLVTFGITPDRPAVEYGYIEVGGKLDENYGLEVFCVESFREKPSYDRARDFVKAGNYLWNSGLFAFKVKAILDAMKVHMPSVYGGLMNIYSAIDGQNEADIKRSEFARFEGESIDYGVMEKANNIACVKPQFSWDDVGSWNALFRHRQKDGQGNVVEGNVVMVDSSNNIALGDSQSLISLVGIHDIIVVKQEDRILICNTSQDQEVKDVLRSLSKIKKYSKYL
jgi:mannose-1-phosphate guanylyltransferase